MRTIRAWCSEQGDDQPTPLKFFRRNMGERDVQAKETNAGYVFQGWHLKNPGRQIGVFSPIRGGADGGEKPRKIKGSGSLWQVKYSYNSL